MVTPKTGRPVGRPSHPEKGAAILDAAWTLFLEHGVEGVALEAIAAKAGVSKATLYKHFDGKPALFEACIRLEMDRIEAAQQTGAARGSESGNTAETLRQFGIGLMSFLVSDPAIGFYSALAGELRRHEYLARSFYDFGPGKTRANLAAIIAAAAARGELDIADPHEAAEHLFGLWQGFSNFQLALGVEREIIRAGIAGRVDSGIAAFLRAYGKV